MSGGQKYFKDYILLVAPEFNGKAVINPSGFENLPGSPSFARGSKIHILSII